MEICSDTRGAFLLLSMQNSKKFIGRAYKTFRRLSPEYQGVIRNLAKYNNKSVKDFYAEIIEAVLLNRVEV